jgi:pyroglutamyl-peptidase
VLGYVRHWSVVVTAKRPTILLTGFGTFPGVPDNATAALVPELAARARVQFPDYDVVDEILPVVWSQTPGLLQQLLKRVDPVLALHFGVTKHTSGFQIELVGRNVCEPRFDALGEVPTTAHLIEAGPEVLNSSFPAKSIVARLERAGLPHVESLSAGTYLCNAVLYHSLTHAQSRDEPFLAGFVHMPAALTRVAEASEDCLLSWDDALKGSLEIIDACLEAETTA